MRSPVRRPPLINGLLVPAAVAVLAALAVPAVAGPVRLVEADETGVTLELALPPWSLTPNVVDGRADIKVAGLRTMDSPGRASLPFASELIALPPGARATVRVISGSTEETRAGTAITLGDRPVFKESGDNRELIPAREPVAAVVDGPWPTQAVELGEPFTLRRQRMVAVRLMPFRYDESIRTLWVRQVLRVRVEFSGGAAVPGVAEREDRSWEPVLREAVLNYEQGRAWREPARPARRAEFPGGTLFGQAKPAGAAAPMAFDESSPEVRVKIDTTGLYVVRFNDLPQGSYPAGVPIAQVSVHRHEFVEGMLTPYVTIELPIEIEDVNNDGVFSGADRITLFVQNWAERSRASVPQRGWGDAEVVYVTQVPAGGLRMTSRAGWRGVAGLTPPASYPWRQRWEKNFRYATFPQDTVTETFHWTENTEYYSRPDTFYFETNHLDTTHAVTVSVTMVGDRDQPHFLWAQYRSSPSAPFLTIIDSLSWFGRQSLTVSSTLPGSTLGEGGVNSLRIWAKGGGPPHPVSNNLDRAALNYYEAAYWRRHRALVNYLPFSSGVAVGESQFRAEGFASNIVNAPVDIRVYDVTDSINPVRLTLDPSHILQTGPTTWDVEFQDSLASGETRRYIAFSPTQIGTVRPRAVPASQYSRVTRYQLTARSVGDYLIIVPEALLPAIDPLVTLRQSQNFNVVVAPLEGLNDEFGGGRKSSHAIKRFTRYAYENWNSRFVLLVGDGSEDPLKAHWDAGPDWVPVHKIQGPVVIEFGYEIIPSDPWYVCMNNCSLVNFIPALQDMAIGRLPVTSLTEAQDVIAKLVLYESVDPDQIWRRNIMLNSDDDYSSAAFAGTQVFEYCRRPTEIVFEQINHNIADIVLNQAGLRQMVVDTLDLSDYLAGAGCKPGQPPPDTCFCKFQDDIKQITQTSITGPVLATNLNQGRLWWNFQGHANDFLLTHEDMFTVLFGSDDLSLFMNDDKPFLFSAFSCHANAFARRSVESLFGQSLGEKIVNLPQRGAIASWASSGYEILPQLGGMTHINLDMARAMFETPPHDEYLGSKGARVFLGEAIALALARYVPSQVGNPNERGIALTYNLLGDPATSISVGEPQAVVLANQVPVTEGQPVRLHTLGDTLRIEADLVSNVEIDSIWVQRTDADGTVLIPDTDYVLTPPFPDTTATGLGGRRYHLSYGATMEAESYRYTLNTRDRNRVLGDFDVNFLFLTQLRVDDIPIADGDPVAPTANLTMRVLSPRPMNPATELILTINGLAQPFTATPVAGDASGREWTLAWTHAPYPIDHYDARLAVAGGTTQTRSFSVVVGANDLDLRSLVAFPNPFDETGTAFSFVLAAAAPADIQIRVYTPAGRLVYERLERSLSPGYHQLPWNGLDAEGDALANGVYFYRVLVAGAGAKHEQIGRLVKLRKPRRGDTP